MRSLLYIHALLLIVLMVSCKPPQNETGYYNIDSLIQVQATTLVDLHARLHKEAELNNNLSDTVFTPPDREMWSRELAIFQDINMINRPIYSGSYTMETGQLDPSSNLTVRVFETTKDLPVVYLKTFYLDQPGKLRKLEAYYRQDGALMKSHRKFSMEFSDINNKSILTSYSIEGEQKMIAGDPVRFVIKGSIEIE